MCICLCATITPSLSCTHPFVPTTAIPGVPSSFPDSLNGAFTPNLKQSDAKISTCVFALTGPSTLTFSKVPFGPTKVTHSSQAN